jgi:hypothetical protein
MQSGQQPSSGGHWWERLFGPRQEEVPPPALPEKLKLPSAWELARTGQLDNMRIGGNKKAGYRTLGDLTNILFNENRALSAGDVKKGFAGPEKLKEAKHAIAHAIINNTLYHPTKVASPRIDKKAQQSPEYKRDFADYQRVMRNAFADQMGSFEDPTRGRSQYNNRPSDSIGIRLVNGKRDDAQSVYAHYGPFQDLFHRDKKSVVIFNPPANPGYVGAEKAKENAPSRRK